MRRKIDRWGKFHLCGMAITGASTGLALVYGAADSTQHAMLTSWQTYCIFFVIFLGAFLGRFIKQ